MDALDAHYPQSCPFCKIAQAYPSCSTSPIPARPDSDLVSPQCHLILSTPHVLAFLDIMPMAPGHILLTTRTHYRRLTELHAAIRSQSHQQQSANAPHSDSLSTSTSNSPTSTSQSAQFESKAQPDRVDDALATSRALGEWLPRISSALCTVTGIEDWNVVQNNGERAAQIVPHIHFHLIPRYPLEQRSRELSSEATKTSTKPMGLARSWKMFGRGTRQDLDDEEGAKLAARLRDVLREQLEPLNMTEVSRAKI